MDTMQHMQAEDAACERAEHLEATAPDFTEQAEKNLSGDFGFADYMALHCQDALAAICEYHYIGASHGDVVAHIKNVAFYGMHRCLWLHGEEVRLLNEWMDNAR